ncbi:MAG: RsmB/NOP family class I SAM-dependent RNA methyltransferase [Alphaproteobacteria bacterium]
MTPAAHILAAHEIWPRISQGQLITSAVRSWAAQHRFAGSRDRRIIGSHLFDIARWRCSFGASDDLAMVIAIHAHLTDQNPEEIVSMGCGHRLPHVAQAFQQCGEIPVFQGHVTNVPDWMLPLFPAGKKTAQALQDRASITLREHPHNPLKNKNIMKSLGFERTFYSPFGWQKNHEGQSWKFSDLPSELEGLLEVQDESSQLACLLAKPDRSGLSILDFCAGGGGKGLLLNSLRPDCSMSAFDADPSRMHDIALRFRRAGLVLPHICSSKPKESYDIVWVDVPCSGSGTWRRQPERRWQLSKDDLNNFVHKQRDIIHSAIKCLAPRGQLIYSTCSLFSSENQDQISWLLKQYPYLEPIDIRLKWADLKLPPIAQGYVGSALQLTPEEHKMDGFFLSILQSNRG